MPLIALVFTAIWGWPVVLDAVSAVSASTPVFLLVLAASFMGKVVDGATEATEAKELEDVDGEASLVVLVAAGVVIGVVDVDVVVVVVAVVEVVVVVVVVVVSSFTQM